jgi:hypothetical protein
VCAVCLQCGEENPPAIHMTTIQSEGPEPDPIHSEGPEPGHIQSEGPDPDQSHSEGPGDPEPVPVEVSYFQHLYDYLMVSAVGRTCVADPDPIGLMDPDLIMSVGSETDSYKQCCGSVTFRY